MKNWGCDWTYYSRRFIEYLQGAGFLHARLVATLFLFSPPLPKWGLRGIFPTQRPKGLLAGCGAKNLPPPLFGKEGSCNPPASLFNPDSAVGTLQLPIPAQDVRKREWVGVLTGAYSVW